MSRLTRCRDLFRSPLARRLTISIILVSSVITLLLTSFQLYWIYRNEVIDIHSDLVQVEQVHLKALSQSLWAVNNKEIKLQLEGIVQMQNIVYTSIYEGERLWTEAGKQHSKKYYRTSLSSDISIPKYTTTDWNAGSGCQCG